MSLQLGLQKAGLEVCHHSLGFEVLTGLCLVCGSSLLTETRGQEVCHKALEAKEIQEPQKVQETHKIHKPLS